MRTHPLAAASRIACLLALTACGSPEPMTSASGTSDGGEGSTTATAASTGDPGTSAASSGSASDASATATTGASASASGSTTADATTSATDPSTTAVSASASASESDATSDVTSDATTDATTSDTTGPACVGDDECPAPPAACLLPACEGGACGSQPADAGLPCDEGGGAFCDGDGHCVACLTDDHCATKLCQDNQCAPASCGDGLKNGDETGVDCGGSCPAKCGDGQPCQGGGDCQSGVCTNNVCKAATCSDGVHNGQESDVDCGGPCPPCADGEMCTKGQECTSGVCEGGVCQPPACDDGIKNGGEADVDCGQVCPSQCPDGDACLADADCESNNCDAGVCKPDVAACVGQAPNPSTGQRCPLFAPCAQSSECGVSQGCQLWFCNNSKRCELDAIGGCGMTGGQPCAADVVLSHYFLPPVDKTFLVPDGVNFREVASIAFIVKNNTASDLYLDAIPLALDVAGGGSKFDVSSAKLFEDTGKSGEHEPGSFFLCVTDKPFQFPANDKMSGCALLAQSRVPKGGSKQFIINLAFAKELTYIADRSYRLRIPQSAGFAFKVGSTFGPAFQGSICGVGGGGFTGAWVTAKKYP